MGWATPQFSRREVDLAGRMVIQAFEAEDWNGYLNSLDTINNWRSSHSFPLNTFQTTLRKKGRRIDADCLVAQRIKRLSSVELKLRRFPGLRLSQIQDIGGCRIVLQDVQQVRQLVDVYRSSDLKHTLARTDDYLEKPQPSGYRGVHLIYKYASDRSTIYNGLKIEVQVRSQYQHAWATAVETVGTFLRQSLKSSIGEGAWLRFFTLMGTAIARIEETAPVEGTPTNRRALVQEIAVLQSQLEIISRLEVYGQALQYVESRETGSDYYLLELDPVEKRVVVKGYARSDLAEAQREYLDVEKRTAETASDAVLVSVDSVAALRKAYPNYFLDTRVFVELLTGILEAEMLLA